MLSQALGHTDSVQMLYMSVRLRADTMESRSCESQLEEPMGTAQRKFEAAQRALSWADS